MTCQTNERTVGGPLGRSETTRALCELFRIAALETLQENVVVDGVKRRTQVEENEDDGLALHGRWPTAGRWRL